LAYLPNDKNLHLLKARAEYSESSAVAIAIVKYLLELNTTDTDVVLYLADLYLSNRQPEKAIELLKNQLANNPENEANRMNIEIALIVALHKNNQKNEAKNKLDALRNDDPQNAQLVLTQASLWKQDKQWNQIYQLVRQWCDDRPDQLDLGLVVARDLMRMNSSDAMQTAEDILRLILQIDTEKSIATNILAELLLARGHPEQAEVLFRSVLSHHPDHVVAMNNLAWILSDQQKKYHEALHLAQRALALDPDYIDLIDTRGVIYYHMGQFQKSVADFEKCLMLYRRGNPAVASVYYHLGRSLNALGKTSDAKNRLEKALTLHQRKPTLSTMNLSKVKKLLAKLE